MSGCALQGNSLSWPELNFELNNLRSYLLSAGVELELFESDAAGLLSPAGFSADCFSSECALPTRLPPEGERWSVE
jgi:hypothetical protein